MNSTYSHSIIYSFLVATILTLGIGCFAPKYTYRCSCNKIAYDSEGSVLDDDSFNQVVCDTTAKIDAVFEGELSELAQDCSDYFEGLEGIAQTDCRCTCDLLGECD